MLSFIHLSHILSSKYLIAGIAVLNIITTGFKVKLSDTDEPPLRRCHREQGEFPPNRGDNYQDYSRDQEKCSLNRGNNYKDYMSVLPAGTGRTFP